MPLAKNFITAYVVEHIYKVFFSLIFRIFIQEKKGRMKNWKNLCIEQKNSEKLLRELRVSFGHCEIWCMFDDHIVISLYSDLFIQISSR